MRRPVPLIIVPLVPLVPLLLLVACDHDHDHDHATSGATCPSDNTLTYESFGRDFFDSYSFAGSLASPGLLRIARAATPPS